MAIGFKEWSAVCTALASGRQFLLLRKGGIAEGREGFSFKHSAFYLVPTGFHQNQGGLCIDVGPALAPTTAGKLSIALFAQCEWAEKVTDWETIERLSPYHILERGVVRDRFDYKEAGSISVALVRVFRVDPVWNVVDSPQFAGCRSWVELPAPPSHGLSPVLSDARWSETRSAIDSHLMPFCS